MPPVLVVVILAVFACAVVYFLLPDLVKRRQVAALNDACRRSRAIVLTFDDGPSDGLTPALVELLNTSKVRASFFMLGNNIDRHPELVKMVRADGHHVGSHSYRHLHAWKASPLALWNDTRAGSSALGRTPDGGFFYRPPFGKLALPNLAHVLLAGGRLAWWTVDSTDTWRSVRSVSSIIEELSAKQGGVVLMHDHCRREDTSRNDFVLELTRALIHFSRVDGYRICAMDELYLANSPERK
jgi:peptidoglycan-N-acetylglucosamine deacetylase